MRRFLTLITAAMLMVVLVAAPASATVHEIVGQWCSGQGDLLPPGITGGSNADNFAQPLFANGFIKGVVAFDPPGPQEPGFLIEFDFDHPASKLVGLGVYVQIDEGPLYIEAFELDTSKGFAHCARLSG